MKNDATVADTTTDTTDTNLSWLPSPNYDTHIDGTPCISALPCPLQNKHRVLHEKSA